MIKPLPDITFPTKNQWGLMVSKKDKLAKKKYVTLNDLKDLPLIVSRQAYKRNEIKNIFNSTKRLNIVNTYNLIFNAIIIRK